MSKTMEELLIYGDPKWTAIRHKVEIPKPGPNEVLIKNVAVGLNPKDWKFTEDAEEHEKLNTGDDVTGVVESVGDGVFEYKPGDRVAAFHKMGEPWSGYAEFTIAPSSTVFRLPPNVTFEDGAGLPLAGMTAAIALYQALHLPLPTTVDVNKNIPVLIYGGASAVGAYALQLAKLSKLSPNIAVAGSGIDFVKSLDCATHIIDYRNGDVKEEVLKVLEGKKLAHVLDAVSSKASYPIISDILTVTGGGQTNMLDPVSDKDWKWPEGVEYSMTFVGSAYGRKPPWISQERADADREFGYWFYRYMTLLLAEGRLKPHPVEVLPGGLNGILQGLQDLQAHKVSAKKLVARIADTPGL